MPADLNQYFNRNNKNKSNNSSNNPFQFKVPNFKGSFGKKNIPIYILIVIVVLLILLKPFAIINSGEVGIKVTTGKFDPISLPPGIHFFIPIVQEIIPVDTKVKIANYSSTEELGNTTNTQNVGIRNYPPISVLDARGLPVSIEITVQYRLTNQNVPQTIATWGLSWESKIIDPVVKDVARSIVGQYAAEDLPFKRNEIASHIETKIRKDIEGLPGKPVNVLGVQLREIVLPKNIQEQIERVQIAKQEVERRKYEVDQAKQEAQKKEELAKGDAVALEIQAKGRAQAIIAEANATSIANKNIAKSLTNNLLELKEIEVQGRFNDALKTNKDAKIFLMPGGSVPNIWVDTKSKEQLSSTVK